MRQNPVSGTAFKQDLQVYLEHAGNLKERQLDHAARAWQCLGELVFLGLCSGGITNHSFTEMVQEVSPCSVHGFAGTEAAKREIHLSYSSRQRAEKAQKGQGVSGLSRKKFIESRNKRFFHKKYQASSDQA